MIEVEGYKAFNGVMRITLRTKAVAPKEIKADWLYKPEHKCWYGNGSSYPAEVCIIVSDSSERDIAKNLAFEHRYFGIGMCPNCGKIFKEKGARFCDYCGQKLDWGVSE